MGQRLAVKTKFFPTIVLERQHVRNYPWVGRWDLGFEVVNAWTAVGRTRVGGLEGEGLGIDQPKPADGRYHAISQNPASLEHCWIKSSLLTMLINCLSWQYKDSPGRWQQTAADPEESEEGQSRPANRHTERKYRFYK